jgi:predicted transcriptional regulator
MFFTTKAVRREQNKIDNIMQKNVVKVSIHDSLNLAARKMIDHNLGKILVEGAQGDKYYVLPLSGINTEDLDGKKNVDDISLKQVPVVNSGTAMGSVFDKLIDNPLVVVKEGPNVKGVVNAFDYLPNDLKSGQAMH